MHSPVLSRGNNAIFYDILKACEIVTLAGFYVQMIGSSSIQETQSGGLLCKFCFQNNVIVRILDSTCAKVS